MGLQWLTFWLTFAVAVLTVVIIPLMISIVRIMIKWTRVEIKLVQIVNDIKELVHDKDKMHMEITKQMGDDRRATDRRLRWLEEHVWKGGGQNAIRD